MKTPNMLFRLQHVVDPDVAVEAYNHQQRKVPPAAANMAYSRDTAPTCVKHIPQNIINLINRDANRLAKLELYPLNKEQDNLGDDDDNDIDSNDGEPETFQNLDDNDDSEEDDEYELVT